VENIRNLKMGGTLDTIEKQFVYSLTGMRFAGEFIFNKYLSNGGEHRQCQAIISKGLAQGFVGLFLGNDYLTKRGDKLLKEAEKRYPSEYEEVCNAPEKTW